jgi:type IV pilus assembly protein PilB
MVDLDLIEPTPELLARLPKTLALRLPAFPLGEDAGVLHCAISDTSDPGVLGDIEFVLGRSVKVSKVPREKLALAVARAYGVAVSGNSREQEVESKVSREEAPGGMGTMPSETSAVVLANTLISDAVRAGASDIHVEPYERFVRIRYRLDGVLQEVSRPSAASGRTLISRLKIMADLDIAEKRRPQDGRIRVKEDDRTIDIRVSTLPTDFGEKVVLRILDKSRLQLDLGKLGFEEEALKTFQKALKLPHGMILVTGPTGSGKTTTLYAALNYINSPGINITTIEDPIEYNLAGINQTHVRSDIGLTFAAALRSILRQDPNVVMVGEIRDGETAEIAVRAALTGHLVLSTLHTNDAPSAITRLIDMGIEPFLVAGSVKMILAQRLLRRICVECREVVEPDPEELRSFGLDGRTGGLEEGRGCTSCGGSGYKGRVAVYELFPTNPEISDLISTGAPLRSLVCIARGSGYRTLRESAMAKVQSHVTSLAELAREITSCDYESVK